MWDSIREYWTVSKVIARLQEESTKKRIRLWAEVDQYHSQDMELWETILDNDPLRREIELDVYRGCNITIPRLLPPGPGVLYSSTSEVSDWPDDWHSSELPVLPPAIPFTPKSRPVPRVGTDRRSASDGSAASHVSSVASIRDAIRWSPPQGFTARSARKRRSSVSNDFLTGPSSGFTFDDTYPPPFKRIRHGETGRSTGTLGGTSTTLDQGADAPTEHDQSYNYGDPPGYAMFALARQFNNSSPMRAFHPNHHGATMQHGVLVTTNEQPQNELTLSAEHTNRGQDVGIDSTLPNQNIPPDSSEQLALYETPISKKMTIPEVVSHLVAHGCQNLTDALNHDTFGQHPVSHGGFSDVYCGNLLDTTQVAVKALRISIQSMAENPKHLKHAARELHTWSKCKHPNVLQLLGFAVFRDRIAMVSPWMNQGNLHRYLERTTGVNRCNLCTQLCEGLSYLHQIEIIHGDLKGANVLISEDGTPVLADFGNSTHTNQSMKFTQTTSERSWTMRWSAPELIMGSGSQSKAADVYALAMTIYEIITATLPYNGKLEHTIIYLVTTKKEPPERPCTIPIDHEGGDKLWELLLCCWSFEPDARPGASEMATILKTITLDDLGHAMTSMTESP
ncbi:Tyrosine-protein kinase JAK3 [Rhizoctonia solani]|uniref:Tyrosine-protein kinase JAK3 n=1 Tax=Rhizoctonia solani TaxID=456999 RepID=A0A0K6FV24_9AGAM|nr:Tyrosine-protein kinase JAK3 [Rhizoctonia solani]